MQLKASTDYALRAVLYLAMEGTVVSSKKISEDIAVPRDYLIQLSQLLRNAGIIEARAGKNGGYVLAKDPSEISFLEIIQAIDEGTKAKAGSSVPDDILPASAVEPPLVEGLHKALDLAFSSFDAYLDSITVDMLVKCAKDVENSRLYLAQQLIKEGERLEAEVAAERAAAPSGSGIAPGANSVTVISAPPHPAAAVASAADIPPVESKSPAARIESKTDLS